MNVSLDRTADIKRELAELNQSLKMTVRKAIRIGQLLTEQKEFVGHGRFGSWLAEKFVMDLSERTARRYMALYEYRDKTAILSDLHAAYQQIETLEAQEKQSKEERERRMIAEYRRTGTKSAEWDRALDYRLKKDEAAAAKQRERVEREFRDREERVKQYKRAEGEKPALFSDALKVATETIIAQHEERQSWKEKIRLSDGGKEDAFMDAIIDYLETLPDDNRRIEACSNIIKICRNISVELQKGKLATNPDDLH